MQSKEHWEQVYTTKSENSVSWFQEHARQSVELIARTRVSKESSIIDVGGVLQPWSTIYWPMATSMSRSWTCRRPRWLHREHGSASEHLA